MSSTVVSNAPKSTSLGRTIDAEDMVAEICSYMSDIENLKYTRDVFSTQLKDSSKNNWIKIHTQAGLPAPVKRPTQSRTDEFYYLVQKREIAKNVIRVLENLRTDFDFAFPIDATNKHALEEYKDWLRTACISCSLLHFAPHYKVGNIALGVLAKLVDVEVTLGQSEILKILYHQCNDNWLKNLILENCDNATFVEFLQGFGEGSDSAFIDIWTDVSDLLQKRLHDESVRQAIMPWLSGDSGFRCRIAAVESIEYAKLADLALSVVNDPHLTQLEAIIILRQVLSDVLDSNDADRLYNAILEVYLKPEQDDANVINVCIEAFAIRPRYSYEYIKRDDWFLALSRSGSQNISDRLSQQEEITKTLYPAFQHAHSVRDYELTGALIRVRAVQLNLQFELDVQENSKQIEEQEIEQMLQLLAMQYPEKAALWSIVARATESNLTAELCSFVHRVFWEDTIAKYNEFLLPLALKQPALMNAIFNMYSWNVSPADLEKVGYGDFVNKTPGQATLHSLAALATLYRRKEDALDDLSAAALEILAGHVEECRELAHYVARCIAYLGMKVLPDSMNLALAKLHCDKAVEPHLHESYVHSFKRNIRLWTTPPALKLMTDEQYLGVVLDTFTGPHKGYERARAALGMQPIS